MRQFKNGYQRLKADYEQLKERHEVSLASLKCHARKCEHLTNELAKANTRNENLRDSYERMREQRDWLRDNCGPITKLRYEHKFC